MWSPPRRPISSSSRVPEDRAGLKPLTLAKMAPIAQHLAPSIVQLDHCAVEQASAGATLQSEQSTVISPEGRRRLGVRKQRR